MAATNQPLRDQLATALDLANQANATPVSGALTNAIALVDQTIAPIDGRIREQFVDLRAMIAFGFQYIGSERYERGEEDKLLTTSTGTLRFYLTDEKAGGKTLVSGLRHPRYRIYAWRYADWDGEGVPPAGGALIADYLRTGKESTPPTASNAAGVNVGAPALYSLPPPDVFPDEIYTLLIQPCQADGTPAPYVPRTDPLYESVWRCRVWLNRTGRAKDHPFMLIENDTYDLTHTQNYSGDGGADGGTVSQWQVLPTSLAVTKPRPLPLRDYTAFGNYPAKREMYREQIVPHIIGNGCRPTYASDGRILTEEWQGYFIEHARMMKPPFALLDGPRNIATCYFPTSMHVGHQLGSYHTTPWSFRHVLRDENRTIITLAGWYYEKAPSVAEGFAGTSPHLRLAGDWSRIPIARRGFDRLWGGVFNWDSVRQGDPTNPVIGTEVVHNGDVIWYCCDGWNRIIELRFNGRDPNRGGPLAEPPRIREIAPPGSVIDGWNVDYHGGKLYIAERGRHRIAVWRVPTVEGELAVFDGVWGGEGQEATANSYLRFEDAGIARGLKHYHRVLRRPGFTVANVRTLESPGVEGLMILVDPAGVPWMFWGGLALEEVRIQRLDKSAPTQVYARFPISPAGKSHFGLFSMSRESFRTGLPGYGPPGMIATVTFSDAEQGWPVLWKANTPANGVACSQTFTYSAFSDSSYAPSGTYNINVGKGGVYCRNVYAMACAIGGPTNPVMDAGGSDEGLFRWSLAKSTDPMPNYKDIEAGAAKYNRSGAREFWGHGGYSKFDSDALPLPDELANDPQVRAYLAWEAQA